MDNTLFYMVCTVFWVSAFWLAAIISILVREANR